MAAQRGCSALDGIDIYRKNLDIVELRRRVGMVFQRPNPFPKSIYDNVAYGVRVKGRCPKTNWTKLWNRL